MEITQSKVQISMERIKGLTLRQIIKKEGSMTSENILEISRQVIESLIYL
jgi:serine/threonine protein kinase